MHFYEAFLADLGNGTSASLYKIPCSSFFTLSLGSKKILLTFKELNRLVQFLNEARDITG